jgi:hypothetical protein
MPASGFSLASRKRNIQILSDFVNRKRLADRIDAPETFKNFSETQWFDPVDFDIEILWLEPHQFVAHAAADEHCAPAACFDSFGKPDDFFREL